MGEVRVQGRTCNPNPGIWNLESSPPRNSTKFQDVDEIPTFPEATQIPTKVVESGYGNLDELGNVPFTGITQDRVRTARAEM